MRKNYYPPKIDIAEFSFDDILNEQMSLSTPEIFPTQDVDDGGGDWDGNDWD